MVNMTQNELRKIMQKYYILDCEVLDVVRFVHDLLYQKAKKLKETEPYAIVTIEALLDAALEVDELEYDVDEIMERGYE